MENFITFQRFLQIRIETLKGFKATFENHIKENKNFGCLNKFYKDELYKTNIQISECEFLLLNYSNIQKEQNTKEILIEWEDNK